MKKLHITVSAVLLYSYLCSANKELEKFVKKTYEYASQNELVTISRGANKEQNAFTYIPDNQKVPFAVLKKGSRAPIESFISVFTRDLGLDNVALSKHVTDLPLKNFKKPADGLIEKYAVITIKNKIPNDQRALIEKHILNSSLNFQRITKAGSEDIATLIKYLDVNAAHKLFLYTLLTFDNDSDAKNISIVLNSDNKFDFIKFDTEEAFSDELQRRNLIYYLPYALTPFSKDIRKIVFSWTPEKLEAAKKILSQYDYKYADLLDRVKAFQAYLKEFELASPFDVLMFAFVNTPRNKFQDDINNTLAYSLIDNINLNENTKLFSGENIYDLGQFFTGGLRDSMTGYRAAIYDFNDSLGSSGSSYILKEFLKFIPNLSYFKKELLEHYIDFVKAKFGYAFDSL